MRSMASVAEPMKNTCMPSGAPRTFLMPDAVSLYMERNSSLLWESEGMPCPIASFRYPGTLGSNWDGPGVKKILFILYSPSGICVGPGKQFCPSILIQHPKPYGMLDPPQIA